MSDRDRFLRELDANFSVQAAAGTGKTTALIGRIAAIARTRPGVLGKLVVVTYTHRAADEMRQRLQAELLKEAGSGSNAANPLLWQGMSKIFIGTIHGFCLRLVRDYGLWLGYGSPVAAAAGDDAALRRDFERSRERATAPEPAWLRRLHRVVPARDISALAAALSGRTVDWAALAQEDDDGALSALRLDPDALDGVSNKNGKAQEAIARWQAHWAKMAARWNSGDDHVPVPAYDETGGAEMIARWAEALGAWGNPLLRAALRAAIREAAEFQEFRLRAGRLLFSDQIVLARRLLGDPEVRARLLGQEFHVLLDEAQDTDPLQFELLAELGRAPESIPFSWPGAGEPPRPGRFVMVGDAQQAIYRDRASIGTYLRYHEALERLTFAETYRCRPAVAAFVNGRFANVLTGQGGQALFVPLVSATRDGDGQVVRWRRPAVGGPTARKAHSEAAWLARRLRELGPGGLGARNWDEVAILCPTRDRLSVIHRALRQEQIPATLHFDRPQAQRPEYLWLAALLTIHVEPNNAFEICGVLREIYGVSDDEIHRFRWPEGAEAPRPIRLEEFPHPASRIEELLSEWQQCRRLAEALPLADAVALWAGRNRLRARLEAVCEREEGAAAVLGLEQLLLRAHTAQQEGKTLREFQDELYRNVEQPASAWEGPQEPRVQLLTMKKAKGLQWDAVIVPFLGRVNIAGGRSEYPKIVCPVEIGAARAQSSVEPPRIELALSPSGLATSGLGERAAADAEEDHRERSRLYYVACTRARHTLVLVDDHPVWEEESKTKGRRLPTPNGYDALRGPGEEAGEGEGFVNPLDLGAALLRDELPDFLSVEENAPEPVRQADAWPVPVELLPIPSPGKHTPSRHEDDRTASSESGEAEEFPPLPDALRPRRGWDEILRSAGNDALAYGNWWHDVLRRWPWEGGEKKLRAFLARELPGLPEGARPRAERELATFLASPLHAVLAALPPGERLQEVSYSRPLPGADGAAVEDGQIDFLYRDPEEGWTILDWKTDWWESPEGADAKLREKYGAQLASYRETAAAFGFPKARLRLYSTALGREIVLD